MMLNAGKLGLAAPMAVVLAFAGVSVQARMAELPKDDPNWIEQAQDEQVEVRAAQAERFQAGRRFGPRRGGHEAPEKVHLMVGTIRIVSEGADRHQI